MPHAINKLLTEMATPPAPAIPVEHRLLEPASRLGRSPKNRAPSLRHKARSQNVVMKESEQSLHKLMEDFELGRLNAFGEIRDTPYATLEFFSVLF